MVPSCHHASVTTPPDDLAVTWWGHASATVEIGGIRIATDPVLVDRLFHLRRYGVTPRVEAGTADLVLLSHLHGDHIHLRSLRRFGPSVPVVAPHGARRLLRRLGLEDVRTVSPGDVLDVAGATIEVLPATHDDRRSPLSQLRGPALGFRVEAAGHSFWFPGDTGLRDDMAEVPPVDLALVPVGGWGPTLGPLHMDPDEGAEAVEPGRVALGGPGALGHVLACRPVQDHTGPPHHPLRHTRTALRRRAPHHRAGRRTPGARARRAGRARLTRVHPVRVSPVARAVATVGPPDVRRSSSCRSPPASAASGPGSRASPRAARTCVATSWPACPARSAACPTAWRRASWPGSARYTVSTRAWSARSAVVSPRAAS